MSTNVSWSFRDWTCSMEGHESETIQAQFGSWAAEHYVFKRLPSPSDGDTRRVEVVDDAGDSTMYSVEADVVPPVFRASRLPEGPR